jgi:hypothetical protein
VSKPRSDGQTLIGVAVDARLLAAIDKKRGVVNRSTFIREMLVDYLRLPKELAAAPDRTGKGGRPRKSAERSEEVPVKSARKKAG